jgi:3-hydroxy-9,10-secoandrosta-1,3,5(10)-triene-9,17-dione monooxygenase
MQSRQEIIERVRALAPRFRKRAEAAEDARRLPDESVADMLGAGIARILTPPRFGGYGLGLDTWFDVALDISKADASHGWCASLYIHHPHIIGMFPEQAQQAIWADGPDVTIAASVHPRAKATRVTGGYRVSGQDSAFASGVEHSAWSFIGAFVQGTGTPEWMFFLIPAGDYTVRDTWLTAGMRATGSNTIVTDNVFVPDTHVISLAQLRDGKGPGSALHDSPIFRTPFYFYSPLTFATPMLGAAQGAYAYFRDWTRTRTAPNGAPVADRASVHVRMARAAADLDAAELLLRRAAGLPHAREPLSSQLMARCARDYARAAELSVAAIDTLMALSGAAGFATSNPIQRAWRDIHFASMHVGVNTENNYAHFGRTEFGLPPDPSQPFFCTFAQAQHDSAN